jgi:hypothetical protein
VSGSLSSQPPALSNQVLWSPTTSTGGASSQLLISLVEGTGERWEPVLHVYFLQSMCLLAWIHRWICFSELTSLASTLAAWALWQMWRHDCFKNLGLRLPCLRWTGLGSGDLPVAGWPSILCGNSSPRHKPQIWLSLLTPHDGGLKGQSSACIKEVWGW